MTRNPLQRLVPHLRGSLRAPETAEITDAQLLRAYLSCRDEEAFAALVRRHGPMVLGVCRRVLTNPPDVDDAFQATFLVLAGKAACLRQPEHLGNWLYGVACRVARKARAETLRRCRHQRPLRDLPAPEPVADIVWREVRAVIDEEVCRLPERYRLPIVLCCLQGLAKREAARQLGWPEGTLSTRLHTARQRLRQRLVRRGLTLSTGSLALIFAEHGAVACSLATVEAAVRAAAGGSVSARVIALKQGALQPMLFQKARTVVAWGLLASLLALSTRFAGHGAPLAPPVPTGRAAADKPRAPEKRLAERTLTGHEKSVSCVAFDATGKVLASSGWDGLVIVWDTKTWKPKKTLRQELRGQAINAVAVSADGKYVAAIYRPKEVRIWEVATGKEKQTLTGIEGAYALAFSPDGKRLAAGTGNFPIPERDPKSGEKWPGGGKPGFGDVLVWDLSSGKKVLSQRAHDDPVMGVAFTPDSQRLASGGGKTVKVWDVQTGRLRDTCHGHTNTVTSVALSPDGTFLASVSNDRTVRLWETATGQQKRIWKARHRLSGIAFSPDGKAVASFDWTLLSESDTRTMKLWDVRSGEVKHLLDCGQQLVRTLAFSPDGRVVVAGMEIPGGNMLLWRLK